jgi:hypothetical protein
MSMCNLKPSGASVCFVLFCIVISLSLSAQTNSNRYSPTPDSIASHKVVLDDQSKLLSWIRPQAKAYDQFLYQRWSFIKTMVPNAPGPAPRSSYPIYFFYCDFRDSANVVLPGAWMNDISERIPNWFESARLYAAYSGDTSVMTIVKRLIDYAMEHGTSPADFEWPNFPYTTADPGATDFSALTFHKGLSKHEVQVDHAGDVGLTYYRLYLYNGDEKYKKAAIDVANTLASHVRAGSATHSPWPYRVIMSTGKATAEYGANWVGSYMLLDHLIKANLGNVPAYKIARKKVKDFLLKYPMNTGFWTDGHTDTDVNDNKYKSNMSASNMALYISDHPEFDPNWKINLPKLIKWTEEYFVFRTNPGEPANQWGANVVGEQDNYLPKMDYQTARYGAQCARWYSISGDETYKEKAYRSLNWVTYANDIHGKAVEHPLSIKGIISWWSDCYGEAPRMFYHAFAAVPEWAPPGENHILYSEGVLKSVSYERSKVEYSPTDKFGTEFVKLAFKPSSVTIGGIEIRLRYNASESGYTLRNLGDGDWMVVIKRITTGRVVIKD